MQYQVILSERWTAQGEERHQESVMLTTAWRDEAYNWHDDAATVGDVYVDDGKLSTYFVRQLVD